MSPGEAAVVVVGLVAGWLIVSRLFTLQPPQADDLPDGEWYEVLGVSRDATPAQIDAAYAAKCHALDQRELRIMTVPEQEKAMLLRSRLDAARQAGKAREFAADE